MEKSALSKSRASPGQHSEWALGPPKLGSEYSPCMDEPGARGHSLHLILPKKEGLLRGGKRRVRTSEEATALFWSWRGKVETQSDLRSASSTGPGGGTARGLSPGGSLALRRQRWTAGGTESNLGNSVFPGHGAPLCGYTSGYPRSCFQLWSKSEKGNTVAVPRLGVRTQTFCFSGLWNRKARACPQIAAGRHPSNH